MYDRAEHRASTDRFWSLIRDTLRDAGIAAPDALRRDEAPLLDHWLSPDLVLSQTCGLPYRARLHGKVQLLACPDMDLPGCPPGYYNSVFVVRQDETRTDPQDWAALRLVFNDTLSQSGWAAPLNHAARIGARFGQMEATGGHVISARMVAEGTADIACVDANTWRLIQRYDAHAVMLREIGRTAPTPGMPLITALGQDGDAILAAVEAALADLPETDRAALCINGLARIPAADFLAVPTPRTGDAA
ncbi:hypothetical protein ATO6_11935 [Oceanicola sp. 22II-s10i]|nr:hypothetical protein ATO6_11935 [Oceanicola sp. 22II-s10i]